MTANKKSLGIFIAIAAAIIHGCWPIATRAVYADGGNATFMIIASTFARALSLCLFCFLLRKPIFQTRRDIKLAATGGFFQTLSIICLFGSLLYLPGPVAIIVLYTHTLMLLFFMAWRREIKLNALIVLTTLAALIGLSFAVDIWHPQKISLIGLCLALISAIATMSRLYVYGHQTQTRDPAIIGAETFLFTALFALPVVLFSAPHLPATFGGIGWAILGCAVLAIGTFGMFYGIAFIGSFQYSLISKLEPLFTALFSAVLIHEVLHSSQYVGMALLMSSLVLYQYGAGKKQGKAALPLAAVES
jgi:drug/metabolite transporter (DMT)-like permease